MISGGNNLNYFLE